MNRAKDKSCIAYLLAVGCLTLSGCDISLSEMSGSRMDLDTWSALAQQFEDARALGNAAACEQLLLKLQKVSEALAEKGKHHPLAQSSLFLGAFYTDNGTLEEAKSYLELAIESCKRNSLDPMILARSEGCLGKLLCTAEDPEAAIPHLLSSAAYLERPEVELDESATLMYLGVLDALCNCQIQMVDAAGLFETSSKQLSILLYLESDPDLVAHALSLMAVSGREIGAIEEVLEAIEMLSELLADDMISDPEISQFASSIVQEAVNGDGPHDTSQHSVADGDSDSLEQLHAQLRIDNPSLRHIDLSVMNDLQAMYWEQLIEMQDEHQHCQSAWDAEMAKIRGQRQNLSRTSGRLGAQGVQAVYITPADQPPTHYLSEMKRIETSFERCVQNLLRAAN